MTKLKAAPIRRLGKTTVRHRTSRAALPRAYPNAAAQRRIVSKARIRLDSRKSVRSFKAIICVDISEIAVGRSLLSAPRTDPYGPNSGIRLPPWVCDGKAFFVTVLPYALQLATPS